MALEFRILGPVEVRRAGRVLDLGTRKQLGVLVTLLLRANTIVAVDRLIDEVWGEAAPSGAPKAVQVYVSGLRKVLEPERAEGKAAEVLVTQHPGYLLRVPPDAYDATCFEALAAEGRRALADHEPPRASDLLREALALWRGPALSDVVYEPFAQREAARLEEERVVAIEDRVEADLACGDHSQLVGELDALVDAHPLRERLWGQLMLAMYRAGRQADALRAYQKVRGILADELGIEPGHPLQQLEHAVLSHAPELELAPAARSHERAAVAPPPRPKPPAARAERKTVTALAARFASEILAGQLDDKEFRLVVGDAMARMTEPLEEMGGTVMALPGGGDGIVAVFGVPSTHEDDPERAVRSALSVRDVLGSYGEEVAAAYGTAPIQARVAVNTGTLLVGASAARVPAAPLATAEAVDVAVALSAAVEAGRVIVSESTRRLIGPLFEWGDRHDMTPADGATPVVAYEVTSSRAFTGKVRGLEGAEIRLVGRNAELEQAGRVVGEVMAGRGRVLFITGDAGIGKSRLLAEVRRRFVETASPGGPSCWLEGHCISYGEALPYWPFKDLLLGWLGAAPGQPELRIRVALRQQLGELFRGGENEVHSFLAGLMGYGRDARSGRLAYISPEAMQLGTFESVRALCLRLAERGPLAVAVDDLHWADASSVQLLERLLPLSEEAPILFVLAARPEGDHASWRLSEFARRELAYRTSELPLDALSRPEDAEMLATLIGADTLPPNLARQVLEAAEGNPFFLEELVRSLVDSGALVHHSGGWRFEGTGSVQVPETVEKVILARVDRLPPECHAVLTAASVLSRQFSVAVLSQIVDEPDQLPAALAQLQHLDLIRDAQRWPVTEYRFKHVLIQDAVYRSLPPEPRGQLHRRAAAAIEATISEGDAAQHGMLARHYQEAGELELAFEHCRRAAEFAFAAHALDEALEHCRLALEVAESLGLSPSDLVWRELVLHRGTIHLERAEFDLAATDFTDVLHAARGAGDVRTELEAIVRLPHVYPGRGGSVDNPLPLLEHGLKLATRLGDRRLQTEMLRMLSIHNSHQLRFDLGVDYARQALAMARQIEDDRTLADAIDAVKMNAAHLGDFDTFGAVVGELEEILSRFDDLWLLQFAVVESAFEPLARARWDEAVARVEQALGVNRRIGDRGQAPYHVAVLGWINRSRGDYGQALALGRSAAGLAQSSGHQWWKAWTAGLLGWTLMEVRDPTEAAICLQQGVRAGEQASASELYLLRCACHLASAWCVLGDRRALDATVAAAQQLATVKTPPSTALLHAGDCYLAMARAWLSLGEPARAASAVATIMGAAERYRWWEWVARGSLLAGRSRLALGDRDEALPLLHRAHEVATSAGLLGTEWEACAALAEWSRATGEMADANRWAAAGRTVVERLAETIEDDTASARFVAAAEVELGY
jgi:DNA-binding SARP family transcriptional activator